jgi:hypothetical protein
MSNADHAPNFLQLALAALDRLDAGALAARASVLSQLAVAQQLERVTVLLAKAGPLLEDLKDLDAIATQLERIAKQMISAVQVSFRFHGEAGPPREGV